MESDMRLKKELSIEYERLHADILLRYGVLVPWFLKYSLLWQVLKKLRSRELSRRNASGLQRTADS